MTDLDFTLLPADDGDISPAQDLEAAIAGAVAESSVVAPEGEEAPVPFGRSWWFDFEAGRFVRAGSSPVPTTGLDSLAQWVLMVMHSARFAHSVFSDRFGMEYPDAPLGHLDTGEMVGDFEARLRDAVLEHDRITALNSFEASFDPTQGVLSIDYFEIVTDEEEVVPVAETVVVVGVV